jgi:hypothetical protein
MAQEEQQANSEASLERHTPESCAHNPYLEGPNPACEGCLAWPLSGASYPDHVSRAKYAELEDRAKAVLEANRMARESDEDAA